MSNVCRACEMRRPIGTFEVRVAFQHKVRAWRVSVCRDCWRAWEALLDQAAGSVQPSFQEVRRPGPAWFV